MCFLHQTKKEKKKTLIKVCYFRHAKTIQFKDFETTVKELSRDIKSLREYISLTRINEHQQVEFYFNFFYHLLEPVFFP